MAVWRGLYKIFPFVKYFRNKVNKNILDEINLLIKEVNNVSLVPIETHVGKLLDIHYNNPERPYIEFNNLSNTSASFYYKSSLELLTALLNESKGKSSLTNVDEIIKNKETYRAKDWISHPENIQQIIKVMYQVLFVLIVYKDSYDNVNSFDISELSHRNEFLEKHHDIITFINKREFKCAFNDYLGLLKFYYSSLLTL